MAEKRKRAHAGGTVPLGRRRSSWGVPETGLVGLPGAGAGPGTVGAASEAPAFSDPVFHLKGLAEGEES